MIIRYLHNNCFLLRCAIPRKNVKFGQYLGRGTSSNSRERARSQLEQSGGRWAVSGAGGDVRYALIDRFVTNTILRMIKDIRIFPLH